MEITDIKKYKSSKYSIYVDGAFFCIFDYDIILKNGLKVGNFYSEDSLEKFRIESDIKIAKEKAFALLSYRDHSKYEILSKLSKIVCYKVAVDTCDYIEQIGLIDDKKFSFNLARKLIVNKKYGQSKVRYELKKKGIDDDLINLLISNIDFDLIDLIKQVIDKKYIKFTSSEAGIRKIINALLRRGYNYSDIKFVIDNYYSVDNF